MAAQPYGKENAWVAQEAGSYIQRPASAAVQPYAQAQGVAAVPGSAYAPTQPQAMQGKGSRENRAALDALQGVAQPRSLWQVCGHSGW
jgi:hypothetical protein